MNYEIQIFAKDKTKIIRFPENEFESLNKMMAWEDLYYALGLVIEKKADKFRENNTVIGRLQVKDLAFDEVVDVMCEDLSPKLTKLLTTDKEVLVVDSL
jgi:hypothetical protein